MMMNNIKKILTLVAVTYITRRAKGKTNVDNTEQRARWFGYKAHFLDVCRVFTTKDIKDDFASILEHDDDMWASIERARDRGIAFKNMPRIFILARSTFLQLTRKNVAKTVPYALSEWKPQKYLPMEESIASQNANIIEEYKEKYVTALTTETHNARQVHRILAGETYSDVYEELLSKLYYLDDEILNKDYFLTLKYALEKADISPVVDLYWVRDIEHSTRKIKPDGSIQQLFQGRNPNIESPLYYEGDRSLVNKEPEHIQIQIHYVRPTNIDGIDFYSPVLALYVPDSCAEKLENMVVRA